MSAIGAENESRVHGLRLILNAVQMLEGDLLHVLETKEGSIYSLKNCTFAIYAVESSI